MRQGHIQELLKQHKISLRKTRGQHFLADPAMAKKIVDLLEIGPQDVVLEIGPGLGMLTEELLVRARWVHCIEIEKTFCDLLTVWYESTGRFEIFNADFLDVDLPSLWPQLEMHGTASIKIVSNLPYYISTAILTRLIQPPRFSRMVLTMQKEVAQRIAAAPGGKTYGSLSVFTQYFCKTKVEWKLSPGAFYPKPKVESAVVSFVPWEKPPVFVMNEDLFFRLLRSAFCSRRKTLRNSLKAFFLGLGLAKDKSEMLLEKCSIDGTRRAETLTMSEFARLSNLLTQWHPTGSLDGANLPTGIS